ncbi:helix-turn-helix domain-containing protein [Sporomusa aerivorans]|uniref:AraC family transcriptional regulator n=1 Tax=Sporomusa aerivorans TaxID=204936 RepID=UPI00352AA333
MNVNLNQLARYYANMNVTIIDLIRAIVPPGRKYAGGNTPPFSAWIFPLRGQARMFFNGVPYEMEYGKIFHAGPNLPLEKEVLGQSEWDYMVLHYQAVGAGSGTVPYELSHFELETGYNTRISDLLQRLQTCCSLPGSLLELRVKSLFFSILDEILTSAVNRRSESGRLLVEKAMEYIGRHYMEPITIPKLADQYGLKSKQFAYLFQKYTGMGPNEYLIEHRVLRAKELLSTTESSVADISACVGYSDPYYFSKLFKKRTGFSPSMLQSCSEQSKD